MRLAALLILLAGSATPALAETWLRCGATINEINTVRKHLSQVKGGHLARLVAPATLEDARGMLWSALEDPDPVVIFEHKGLYWSKVPGTEAARTIEPAADGSIVTWDATLELKGIFRVFSPVLALMFDRIGAKAEAGLQSTLPDAVKVS